MNYDVNKQKISVRSLSFEGCQEVPVDLDFSLPDYCPDIQKILSCKISPNISSKNISGDRLNIEGTTGIKIIYTDPEKTKLRCYENSAPFSCSIDIKSTTENAVALTFTKPEYINCRAVNPRKVDIHGAFSVCTKIYVKEPAEITESVNGKDLEQKIRSVDFSDLVCLSQQQFSINETLEFGENESSPEVLIHSGAVAAINDYKVMPNKIVIKGNLNLKLLYISDPTEGTTKNIDYNIPISQIIDVPGANENSKYIINAKVISHVEQIERTDGQKPNMISTETKISATVMVYDNKKLEIAEDLYSTDFDIETESKVVNLNSLSEIIKENFSHKDSVKLSGTSISKIIDIWSDNCLIKSYPNEENPNFTLKMNLCIIALDKENTPFYIERIMELPYSYKFKNKIADISPEIEITPMSIGYSIPNENTVDIKINFCVCGAIYTTKKINMITSAQTEKLPPKNKETSASLTIYYAKKGENLWDIARKYYTSLELIQKENNLSEETTKESGMILIPMK